MEKCTTCSGRGMKVITKQIGPGMIQQMQSPCDVCKTQGEIIAEGHKCGACKGKKTTKDKKIIEVAFQFLTNLLYYLVPTYLQNFCTQVHVDPGIASNHRFTFYGDGDQEPGKDPGDVIIQLEEKSHDIYQRHGRDIAMRMDLTLSE